MQGSPTSLVANEHNKNCGKGTFGQVPGDTRSAQPGAELGKKGALNSKASGSPDKRAWAHMIHLPAALTRHQRGGSSQKSSTDSSGCSPVGKGEPCGPALRRQRWEDSRGQAQGEPRLRSRTVSETGALSPNNLLLTHTLESDSHSLPRFSTPPCSLNSKCCH